MNRRIEDIAKKLIKTFEHTVDDNWIWFEENLTYGNSIMPEALLYAYLSTSNPNYKLISHLTFEFLLSHMFIDNTMRVISNNGWLQKGSISNKFGEQPIDVSYTIQTLDLFYNVFKKKEYLDKIEIAFSWFLGNNHLNQIIYNPHTGGCCDGLEEHNVNLNQGAESTVCYLAARLVVEKIKINIEKNENKIFMDPEVRISNSNTLPQKSLRKLRIGASKGLK